MSGKTKFAVIGLYSCIPHFDRNEIISTHKNYDLALKALRRNGFSDFLHIEEVNGKAKKGMWYEDCRL